MATNYKVLGQVSPGATSLTTLYTTPANTQVICSTLAVCNRGESASFRIAVRPTGEAVEDKHYIVYDNWVNNSDTIFLTLGITMSSNDVVSVYSSSSNVSFSLFGTELS